MSEEMTASKASGQGVGRAIGGVVFSDFIGVLLFAVPAIGWLLGFVTMFAVSPLVAWVSLEEHSNRRALVWQIGICNAVGVIIAAAALFAFAIYLVGGVQFG